MNHARIKLPDILKNKSKREIKELIETNIYNINYKNIAISYYVFEECQIDIAIQYNVDKKTIKKILNKVITELEIA